MEQLLIGKPRWLHGLAPQEATKQTSTSSIAKDTAALIRKLATLKAAQFQLEPSEEIRRWYVALSCCVQRANAKILRGEAVPGRRSRVPERLLCGRDDLALCKA